MNCFDVRVLKCMFRMHKCAIARSFSTSSSRSSYRLVNPEGLKTNLQTQMAALGMYFRRRERIHVFFEIRSQSKSLLLLQIIEKLAIMFNNNILYSTLPEFPRWGVLFKKNIGTFGGGFR